MIESYADARVRAALEEAAKIVDADCPRFWDQVAHRIRALKSPEDPAMNFASHPTKPLLGIWRCPHGTYAVMIESPDGTGDRITPGRCCKQWKIPVAGWELSPSEWREIADLASEHSEDQP